MSVSSDASRFGPGAPARGGLPAIAWERTLRLGAGLVLFTFVTLHLLNHALGIFGVEVLEHVQNWRIALWQNPIGTSLLYGAFATHIVLVMKRLVTRRSLRIPIKELLQIGLGLTIPFLLIEHAVGTRVAAEFHGVDEAYNAVLRRLWPDFALRQSILVLVAWTHGVLGVHFAFRARRWPPGTRFAGLVLAILIPALAITGFISAAREAHALGALRPPLPETMAMLQETAQTALTAMALTLAFVATSFGFRAMRRSASRLKLRYKGHGEVNAYPGPTLLEISRENRIPHPSICGGRGRCATCRVLVSEGLDSILPPDPAERALLERISAPPGVRLACRIRPSADLGIQILLPVGGRGDAGAGGQEDKVGWGMERAVTVLVIDLRAFTALARRQVPYELVVLLNRFAEEMSQAVQAHDGTVDMFFVDGLTAIFRKESDGGARDALRAARDMQKALAALNQEFRNALALPLRAGIGIHTGHTIMARLQRADRGSVQMALGETVAVASRLEQLTKEQLADVIISKDTALAAKLDVSRLASRDVSMSVLERAITIYPLQSAGMLDQLV